MGLKKTIVGLERAYTLIIIFSLLMVFFVKHEVNYLIFAIALGLNSIFNQFLKNFVFMGLMGSKEFPLLGRGKRPKGAKDCGDFIDVDSRESTTYGMPSGHSSFAAFFATVMVKQILDEDYSDNLKLLKILIVVSTSGLIMFSRINLGCHTPQQVFIGGILGCIFGHLYHSNLDKIKSFFKIN